MVNKKNYEFYIDEKVTLWQRHKYVVNADSYEEALDKVAQELNDQEFSDDIFVETDMLYDTIEYIDPKENNGQSTKELIYENKTILTNEIS